MGFTPHYGLEEVDYGVTGWNAILTANMQKIDTAMHSNALLHIATTIIDAQETSTRQVLYTVPEGEIFIPIFVVVRSISASLAGLVDMDIGGNAANTDWLQQISLDDLTDTFSSCEIRQPAQVAGPPIVPEKKITYTAGKVFSIQINTGATGEASFTTDLFGYLFE